MPETTQMNILVRKETKEHITQMAAELFRTKGGLIDWLVAEAWEKLEREKQQ